MAAFAIFLSTYLWSLVVSQDLDDPQKPRVRINMVPRSLNDSHGLEGWREKRFTHVSCMGNQKSHNGTSTIDSAKNANSMTHESPEQFTRFFFCSLRIEDSKRRQQLLVSSFIYIGLAVMF